MSEQQRPINELVDIAMKRLREMVDSNTVIGSPIQMPNGATAVPICKISLGYASGGSDLPAKTTDKELFGGGAGGGITVTPIAFLVEAKDGVKLLQLDSVGRTADNIVRAVPEVIDKVSGIISGGRNTVANEE